MQRYGKVPDGRLHVDSVPLDMVPIPLQFAGHRFPPPMYLCELAL